jgi:hypothetical protein
VTEGEIFPSTPAKIRVYRCNLIRHLEKSGTLLLHGTFQKSNGPTSKVPQPPSNFGTVID